MNGVEGFEVIEKDVAQMKGNGDYSFGLILMDLNMPVMDGFECTKKIRNLYYFKNGLEIS